MDRVSPKAARQQKLLSRLQARAARLEAELASEGVLERPFHEGSHGLAHPRDDSSSRLILALEATTDGLWEWHVPTGKARFSDRYYTMLGYEPGDFPADFETWKSLLHPDDVEPALHVLEEMIETRAPGFEMEFRILRQEGTWHWVRGRGRVVSRDEEGRPVCLVGSHVDIDAYRRAAQALADSQREQKVVLDTVSARVSHQDRQMRILWANQAAVNSAGGRSDDLVGRKCYEVWNHRGRPCDNCPVLRCMDSGHPEESEMQTPDGRSWIVRGAPVRNAAGRISGAVEVTAEITAMKRTEDALRRRSRELERSNKELEQFAYIVSHDLQEPLRMVASYCQLLDRRYGGSLDRDGRDFLRFAVDGARRMQALIGDLLAYSRINTQTRELTAVSLEDIVQSVLRDLEQGLRDGGAEIVQDSLPDVLGEPMQLMQLYQNLIGNALKFRGERPLKIRLGAGRRGGYWHLSVGDTGIGIGEEFHQRIFMMFQRLHTREEYPGTGIGLAICQRIVERHGGRIWVESAPGEGSTFHFTIRGLDQEGFEGGVS